MEPFSILIAGVGGQGSLVATRVLARAAMDVSLSPILSETFGASRRGGTVFTHLRLCRDGVNGASPLIPRGRVDLLLGLEPMESLRAAVEYGSRRTTAFISNLPIHTTDTASGRAKYPDTREVFRLISRICGTVYEVNVEGLIRDAGTLMLNVFVLGVVAGSGVLPIPVQTVRRFVQDLDTSVGGNLASFERGVEMGRNLVRV